MKVCVSGSIDCAHQLSGTEVHGHTYTVTACVSRVHENGKAYPIEELQGQLNAILWPLDHTLLNLWITDPTAEGIAVKVQKEFAKLEMEVSVRVQIGNWGYVETE